MDSPGLSIIIAAHNEAAVIEQTLNTVLANPLDRPLQVIVVANGCTDDTAERARMVAVGRHEGTKARRGEGAGGGGTACLRGSVLSIEVIDTPIGNKIHALNLGDRAARYFPRAFMDADVLLSPGLLQEVVDAFERPGIHIVAPGCRHLYRGRNPLLAGYYRLWRSLPYVRGGMMARGFYAIDRELRSRFEEFPSLTADDKFIRNLSRPEERFIAPGCHTTVYMPGSFADLIRVKTRWTYGNLELAARRPDLNANDQDQHGGALRHILLRPWHWLNLPAFLFVYAAARRAARRRMRENRPAWERAESSRGAAQRIPE